MHSFRNEFECFVSHQDNHCIGTMVVARSPEYVVTKLECHLCISEEFYQMFQTLLHLKIYSVILVVKRYNESNITHKMYVWNPRI